MLHRTPPGGGKKTKHRSGKSGTRRRLYLGLIIAAAVLLTGAALFVAAFRPRPAWYVDEALAAAWSKILRGAEPAVPFTTIKIITADSSIPKDGSGFIISSRSDLVEKKTEAPVQVYPWLARTLEWKDALVLAANPWMVFHKHQVPDLPRQRVDSTAGGEGILIIPGGHRAAVEAWLAQLLQTQPGIFPQDRTVWEEAEENLFSGGRFQHGARTYRWVDVWSLFFRNENAWVYAPLSMVRELSPYRMGLLDAAAFPERHDWNEYGVQADILWAVPLGTETQRQQMSATADWLKSPEVQTSIADTINWIPAHPSGTPYNPVSWKAQLAWMRSSFIWQGAEYVQD